MCIKVRRGQQATPYERAPSELSEGSEARQAGRKLGLEIRLF